MGSILVRALTFRSVHSPHPYAPLHPLFSFGMVGRAQRDDECGRSAMGIDATYRLRTLSFDRYNAAYRAFSAHWIASAFVLVKLVVAELH